MNHNPDYERRRAEFFALSDFDKYVYPLLVDRRDELVIALIDKGREEDRFRIKEIDRLVEIFETVGTKESGTNL